MSDSRKGSKWRGKTRKKGAGVASQLKPLGCQKIILRTTSLGHGFGEMIYQSRRGHHTPLLVWTIPNSEFHAFPRNMLMARSCARIVFYLFQ